MDAPRWPRFLPLAVLGALALLPGAGAAQSQTTSTIRGTVTGPGGEGLADVAVRVRHGPTGAARSVLTGPDGSFVVLLLQPGGPYELTASLIGFADATRSEIHLAIGETFTAPIELQPTAVPVAGVSVDVARGDLVSRRRVGPVTLLDEPVLGSLPIPTRDVMDLAVVSTLVHTSAGGGFSVAGQNDRYNSLLVDGLHAGDAFGLTPSGVPGAQAGARLLPLDAVAQYEILVAPYDARLSGFAGGVLNAVTRTGTNDFTLHAFALGRDAALTGDLTLPSGPARASGIRRELVGLSAGGPLARDRIHWFLAGEVERRTRSPVGYNSGKDDAALVGITPETLELFKSLFDPGHGVDTGEFGPYALHQDLANLFARVDWSFVGGSRLTVRTVFARAANDESPNRTPFEPYGFSSNAVFRTSTHGLLSAQLLTDLGDGGGNELDLSLQRTTDRTTAAGDFPQVEAVLTSPFFSQSANRPIRVGAQFYAQGNDLEQTSARLTNTLTRVRGRSTVTLGASAAWHGIRQQYLPGEMGEYYFATWADVLDNAPLRYQRTVLLDGQSPHVAFDVAELGAFAQDQIELDAFTLRFGLRLDAPYVLDRPGRNEDVAATFGRNTGQVPSGAILLSPRIGLNWQSGGVLRTQVRAGAGLFTGQLPYVWLANAFHDTGLRSEVRACFGRWNGFNPTTSNVAPPFDPRDPAPTCLNGPPTVARTVTVFDEDFHYPQYAKVSLAADRELTPSLAASVEVIFGTAIHQVALRELNIARQDTALGPLRGYGGTDRLHYGAASAQGFEPNRILPDYGQVLLVTNGSGDRSWSISGELRGSLTGRLDFRAGYAYGRSYDRMSLTSVDLIGAFGSTPTHGDPNEPPLTPSNFDRPHKVVLALYGTPIPGLDDTEVSVLYTGESGLPFSYVYRGDLNGDGYPSLGKASDRDNDLVYVPADPLEVPAGPGTTVRLAAALAMDPCLRRFSGRMLLRNQCRSPWQNRLDLRLAQRLRVGGAAVRIEADLVNVLNLLDADRGLVRTIPASSSLLQPTERTRGTGDLFMQWIAGLLPLRDEAGTQRIPEPWSVASPESQWQAQIGVRVSLGGGR
jgi:hypothetical protein